MLATASSFQLEGRSSVSLHVPQRGPGVVLALAELCDRRFNQPRSAHSEPGVFDDGSWTGMPVQIR